MSRSHKPTPGAWLTNVRKVSEALSMTFVRRKGSSMTGTLQITGEATPDSGEGLEIFWSSVNKGVILSYDRTNTNYENLKIYAATIQLLPQSGGVQISNVKSGATQVGAGAAAGEIWKTASHATLPDNVLMIGV